MSEELETLEAAAAQLRAGVEHCAPGGHDHIVAGKFIAVLAPALAESLGELIETACGHLPMANPGKEPWGCQKCECADGVGACDVWVDALAVARVILGSADS